MSDEYTYDPYSEYSEEDIKAGGEQVPSAVYVNGQVQASDKLAQEAKDLADSKANPVAMQPTEPPLNPREGDMWMDTSVFPHIIYAWTGAEWKRASVISAEEVGAYTVAESDEQRSQIELNVAAVESRTTVVEGKVDPDSITDVVTNHQVYKDDRDAAVGTGISNFQTNLADETWVNENLPKMTTESILKREADRIIGKFEKGGGVNKLRNSVGYAGLLNWQLMSGAAEQITGGEMIDAESGFAISTGVIQQIVACVIGEPYTLTMKVKKGTAGTAYMKISDGTNFQQVDMVETQAYDFTMIQVANFIPTSPTLIVEIGASGASAIFTAAMLNTGETGYQWSLANGELYNTNVQMDINGLNVRSNVYDGYTVMSPEEFSGYARNNQGVMEKVFTLNKDTTEMTKTQVDEEMMMGTLKMVRVSGGGNSGWALVPST